MVENKQDEIQNNPQIFFKYGIPSLYSWILDPDP